MDVTSVIRLCQIVVSIFQKSLILALSLAGFDETNCHMNMARNRRRPPTNSQQGAGSGQQQCELGSGAFLSQAPDEAPSLGDTLIATLQDPKAEAPAEPCPDSRPRKLLGSKYMLL